jgi:Zn-dependent peptidase ImmA (M78 family)/transcriptional regulator with XRE-family HTH domain
MPVEREAMARALRDARENRGMSREVAAKRLGLSRTVLAQIELGNRRVSDDELGRFAALYEASVADLAGVELPSANEFEVMVFELLPEFLLDEESKTKLNGVLALHRLASSLKRRLGRKSRREAAQYGGSPPRGAAEAIAQGEHVAEQERRRLGLFSAPVANVADLVASQGVHVSVTDLPSDISGFFLRHPGLGSAIVVNAGDPPLRRRFAILNSYAHGLFERGNTLRVARRSNAGELIAKRANAFAAAFLLPESGVRDFLESLEKGHGTRKEYAVLDLVTDEATRAEQRAAPGAQAITYANVVALAAKFGASYKATVLRLLSIGITSGADSDGLLSTKKRRAAEQCLALTRASEEREPSSQDRSGLKAEVLHLTIESYRRDLLTKDRLGAIVELLQFPDLSEAKLLELAEAAR